MAQLSSSKMADVIFFSQRIITKVSNRPKLKEFNSEQLLTHLSFSYEHFTTFALSPVYSLTCPSIKQLIHLIFHDGLSQNIKYSP